MIIPKEITTILSLISNGMIWVYIVGFLIFSYFLVSLLTWNFKKPLKYLGIPTIFVGIIFLIIRLLSSILVNIAEISSEVNLIKVLLPSVLSPILIDGLICLGLGIFMIVLYKIISKKENKNNKIENDINRLS